MISFYRDSDLGVFTLNNAAEGNCLNPPLLQEFLNLLDEAEKEEVRCLLIRSNGSAFCHGMDFSYLRKQKEFKREELEAAIALYGRLLNRLYTFPAPVIAAVQGSVKAGGVGMAAASDAVFCTDRATFEMGEVLFGLIPANVLPYLLNRCYSAQKARYLILSARLVPATEARELGLADEVCPEHLLEKKLKALIKQVMRSSPSALKETKDFLRRLRPLSHEGKDAAEQKKIIELISEPRNREAIQAFSNGELPSWFSSFRPREKLLLQEVNP